MHLQLARSNNEVSQHSRARDGELCKCNLVEYSLTHLPGLVQPHFCPSVPAANSRNRWRTSCWILVLDRAPKHSWSHGAVLHVWLFRCVTVISALKCASFGQHFCSMHLSVIPLIRSFFRVQHCGIFWLRHCCCHHNFSQSRYNASFISGVPQTFRFHVMPPALLEPAPAVIPQLSLSIVNAKL